MKHNSLDTEMYTNSSTTATVVLVVTVTIQHTVIKRYVLYESRVAIIFERKSTVTSSCESPRDYR